MSKKVHELLTKILRAVPERSRDKLEEIGGENFVKWGDGNVSDFQKKKASGMMANDFRRSDEKDETHPMMLKVEPLLTVLDYRTWRNKLPTHGQTFWYPKRVNLVLDWDAGELFSVGLPDQAQNVSILVVSVMLAVKWLEANEDK